MCFLLKPSGSRAVITAVTCVDRKHLEFQKFYITYMVDFEGVSLCGRKDVTHSCCTLMRSWSMFTPPEDILRSMTCFKIDSGGMPY